VHLPEHALSAGCFGGLGGEGCLVVNGIERKVAINDAQFSGKSVYQTLEQGSEPRTTRSLKIAVFDQRQVGVGPSSLGPIVCLDFRDLPGGGRRG